MQQTSDLYQQIWAGNHWAESKINIAGTDYGQDAIVSMSTTGGLFADDTMSIGGAVAKQIDLVLWNTPATFPRMAKMIPYYRITNGTQTSEWIQKGVYYIDTRSTDSGLLTIHGYDDMLKADQIWTPSSSQSFPMAMSTAVNSIAALMGVEVDPRTQVANYTITRPELGVTARNILQYIAVASVGNWIMSDEGKLLLVRLGDIPDETYLLVDEDGDAISFGGDFILVG